MTLRRCPFCGSTESPVMEFDGMKWYWVECAQCESAGPICDTASEAAARWNVRRNHRVERAKNFIRAFINENKPNE